MASRLTDGLPRTNNATEGWHSGIKSTIGVHPTLWKFIIRLRRQNATQATNFEHAVDGRDEIVRCPGNMWLKLKIENLWERYRGHLEDNVPLDGPKVVEYLEKIANCFRMVES